MDSTHSLIWVESQHCSHSPRVILAPLSAWVLGLAVLLSGCGGGGDGGTASASPAAPAASATPVAPAASSVPAPDVAATTQPPAADPAPEPSPKSTLQASQPGELLAYVKAKLNERQKLRVQAGTNSINFSGTGDVVSTSGAVFSAGSVEPPAERSSTVVQEEGVDEDDLVKSDGSTLYTLSRENSSRTPAVPARVTLHRRLADGATEVAGRVTLEATPDTYTRYTGMYLANTPRRLAVLGSVDRWMSTCDPAAICISPALQPSPYVNKSTVALDVVNIADANRPVLSDKLRIDGRLVGSRMIGNSLVLVTQFTPNLAVETSLLNAPAAEREAAMGRLTAAELLPTFSANGGPPQPLMAETECYVEPKNASYGLEVTSITIIDVSSATLQRSSRCFIGGSEALYMSTSALYLATTSYAVQPLIPLIGNSRLVYPPQITTDIHKFSLGNGGGGTLATVNYRGSGTVPGHLGWSTQQRSYRMSEYNGDLRVLSFTGESGWGALTDATSASAPKPSPATVTVLREQQGGGKALQTVGQLPNPQRAQAIGKPGEQVYAVRFIGPRGYVVTFRRTDPLYVLDLSNPVDPKATGELTVAGFSDYLFPVGPPDSGLLLGVGKDADERGVVSGVKVALFDVADPGKPAQSATATIGGMYSLSALDFSRHGIDLFTRGDQTRVVLPVSIYQPSGYILTLQRLEVDAASRTMRLMAPWTRPNVEYPDLSQNRTLQIGEKVHHFDGETVTTLGW